MVKEDLREKYRRKLTKLHLTTISVISAVEIAAYLYFVVHGAEPLSFHSRYLWVCVLLPILINYTGHGVAEYLMRKDTVATQQKDAAITYAILITSASMAMIHRVYVLSLCAFTFPLVLCGFFNDRKLLNRTLLLSLIALAITTCLMAMEQPLDSTFLINQVAAYGFVLISFLSSKTAINFSHTSFSTISYQAAENDQLQKRIRMDQMTGAYNHTAYTEEINAAVKTHRAGGPVFCLAMIDLDNFKSVNDTYGHDRGDQVLITLCRTLRENCGAEDVICRYGGEEFAVILKNKNLTKAKKVMEAARRDFAGRKYGFTEKPITFSCGLSQHRPEDSAEDLFVITDRLLYAAKNGGKNRICTSLQQG